MQSHIRKLAIETHGLLRNFGDIPEQNEISILSGGEGIEMKKRRI
ncbi:hypothetical protein BGP_3844 [Beggiatoa sp. PS]|nr:hypothetical protein BGP_3844 [Beggiatoa sp. PS]